MVRSIVGNYKKIKLTEMHLSNNNVNNKLASALETAISGFFMATNSVPPPGSEKSLANYLAARFTFTPSKSMPTPTNEQANIIFEAKTLMGKNLVNYLTVICLDSWYSLQKKFSGSPDTFDVHLVDSENPDFEVFKMTPGVDKRDVAFEYIMTAASQLTKSLNSAFGKEVFEQKVSRTSGTLQVLVAFSAGKGGVLQCKAENNVGGNTTIILTMPNREELVRAFSAMTDTPHPKDEMLPADEFEAPDVAGRAVPKSIDTFETQDFTNEAAQTNTWRVTWTVAGKEMFEIVKDPEINSAEEAVKYVKERNPEAKFGRPVASQVAGIDEMVTTGDAAENIGHQPMDGPKAAFMRRWKNTNGFGLNPFGKK